MNPSRIHAALLCLGLGTALTAAAQPSQNPAPAQQRYEREVAACNNSNMAAPAREACIRAAGNALDRTLGGPPANVAVPSADGRATVVTPAGSTSPSSGSDAVPSSDGRATIVLPADRAATPR